ncbi:hypothetical protein RKE30_35445 [Streptomyces sp. Li-HN-5-11]|uniref:hypothetical protein n=1 Tax=Streptomyces sp. Li-HN-5-11 TaxID=3075432 RepID=UPI0028AB14AB|nr:hypothetical protein [Streptomyces sp. Li-HN-5-11]WNM35288.1 hypothetical protein RKE30_35445 [Streptomyces sp. Li-HN-5-11]
MTTPSCTPPYAGLAGRKDASRRMGLPQQVFGRQTAGQVRITGLLDRRPEPRTGKPGMRAWPARAVPDAPGGSREPALDESHDVMDEW